MSWRIASMLLALVTSTVACRTTPAASGVRTEPGARAAARPATAEESAADAHRRMYELMMAREYPRLLDLVNRILATSPSDSDALYIKAVALNQVGQKAAASACLRDAFAAGLGEITVLTRDPLIQSLAGDPGFDALMKDYDPVVREERTPGVDTMRQILAEPRFRRYIPRLLPRYRSPGLTGATLGLLDSGSPSLVRAAIVALSHQNADDAAIRERVAARLASPEAEIREAAATYFLWHGHDTDRAALSDAAAREEDPYVAATERNALELVATRGGWAGLSRPPAGEPPPVGATSCSNAIARLKASPTVEVLREVGDVYRFRWDADPRLNFQGMTVDRAELLEHYACFNLAASIFRFTGTRPAGKVSESAPAPLTSALVPPVRGYLDSSRTSYGARMPDMGPFRSSVHVGDDVAWHRDEGTVVSIGDGIVRHVGHTYSWGFIVIIEHRLRKGGAYCSLYGHLAPSLVVAPGQLVTKGQRIASVGRTFTWENGGYAAHLHFGIHRGAYLQSRQADSEALPGQGDADRAVSERPNAKWVTGYVSRARWADGGHGWVDPQRFIRDRMARPPASDRVGR